MAKEIELSSLDLRYEGHRMKNPGLEERLLVSIVQRGIEEPLEGVQRQEASILRRRFQAVSLCAQAATSQRAVRFAGRGRGSRNHEPFADFQQQGLEHPGAGGVHRRTLCDRLPERGRDGKRAFAQ
jgi:hypothetical protein